MKKRIFAAILSCSLLLTMPMQVNAASPETSVLNAKPGTEAEIQATGLISYYFLTISGDAKKLYISAHTHGTERLAKLGFKDIVVERSSNGVSNWTEEKDLGNKLKEDAISYTLSNYEVSVTGGYYYRVKLTHYAKEDKLLFPTTQSVQNTSNAIWISK